MPTGTRSPVMGGDLAAVGAVLADVMNIRVGKIGGVIRRYAHCRNPFFLSNGAPVGALCSVGDEGDMTAWWSKIYSPRWGECRDVALSAWGAGQGGAPLFEGAARAVIIRLVVRSAKRIKRPAATRAGQGRAHPLDTLISTRIPVYERVSDGTYCQCL